MSFEVREHREPDADPLNGVVVVAASLVMAAAGIAFVVLLIRGDRVTGVGTALAVGLAAGAVAVRRLTASRYPRVEALEGRHVGQDVPGPVTAVRATPRRRLLGGVLGGASLVVLTALMTPLRFLGPAAGQLGVGTAWARGVRLVDGDGRPLREDDVPAGGIGTVWPEHGVRGDTAAVVLVRLSQAPEPPVNPAWVVGGRLVAYSKVCTHMGCPVGLFQEGAGSLFCPCHQARFDATRGARPLFGPPARPLPQLPLGTDADGYLIALDDFTEQVGPSTGARS